MVSKTRRSTRDGFICRVTREDIIQIKHKGKWIDMNIIPKELEDLLYHCVDHQEYDKVFSVRWGK